jgi:hypothetical protein
MVDDGDNIQQQAAQSKQKTWERGWATWELPQLGRQDQGVGITHTNVRSLTVGEISMGGGGVALYKTEFFGRKCHGGALVCICVCVCVCVWSLVKGGGVVKHAIPIAKSSSQ